MSLIHAEFGDVDSGLQNSPLPAMQRMKRSNSMLATVSTDLGTAKPRPHSSAGVSVQDGDTSLYCCLSLLQFL